MNLEPSFVRLPIFAYIAKLQRQTKCGFQYTSMVSVAVLQSYLLDSTQTKVRNNVIILIVERKKKLSSTASQTSKAPSIFILSKTIACQSGLDIILALWKPTGYARYFA